VGTRNCSLLVVDDEPYILPTLSALVAPEFQVYTADSADSAEEVFRRHPIDLVLTDQNMPRRTGVQFLEWVRQHHPRTIRLLMTGYAELEDAVDAINRGQVYHYLLKPWRTEELLQVLRNAAEKFTLERNRDELLDELHRAKVELEQRVADRTRALEETNRLLQQRTRELERLALTDPLTGLLNRRAMEESASFELKRHKRFPGSLTFALIDADHFKDVNTQYLLPGGDEVLRGLAKLLTASLREVDLVGRMGGEEFLVIAPETSEEGAVTLAERIRSTVAQTPIIYGPHSIHITVSIGLAVAEAGVPATFERMYATAAAALSAAKDNGRNRYVVRNMAVTAGGSSPG
jgi:diguanylate cyclase (GGDEF)-like protein